ncbi:ATP-grasp domain-containing protein [Polaromonas sp.]|uniref:ATP-grasp domain-containing protein n=1 Tax=Polaromonas sp. TaxID=1869339 RepID=UPI00181F5A9A|nr:ATP-grasp domain-containing protein [Polaromonas sp.]NMM04738.1 ATP-grasp domain-containing protein [Polaromonas sp.]
MKIFICQHACGMPMAGTTSSAAGFRGEIMLRALLADITRAGQSQVSVLRDPSLGFIDQPNGTSIIPWRHQDAMEKVDQCIREADAIWPLAPESNGVLESISRRVLLHNKVLLGCRPAAIHLTGSKFRTSRALRAAGIAAVPTYHAHSPLPSDTHAWVVKPDDGAGCSDTRIFSPLEAARKWIAVQKSGGYVLQPYISGRPCSLSVLCGNGDLVLLGCNDQRVAVSDNQFHDMGSTVNGIEDDSGELERLTRRVISALPDMWGYVGIDFIRTDQGPVVLEVNPRMTLSHAGLHASIGANPVEMLLAMLRDGHWGVSKHQMSRRQVSVDVNAYQYHAQAASTVEG